MDKEGALPCHDARLDAGLSELKKKKLVDKEGRGLICTYGT